MFLVADIGHVLSWRASAPSESPSPPAPTAVTKQAKHRPILPMRYIVTLPQGSSPLHIQGKVKIADAIKYAGQAILRQDFTSRKNALLFCIQLVKRKHGIDTALMCADIAFKSQEVALHRLALQLFNTLFAGQDGFLTATVCITQGLSSEKIVTQKLAKALLRDLLPYNREEAISFAKRLLTSGELPIVKSGLGLLKELFEHKQGEAEAFEATKEGLQSQHKITRIGSAALLTHLFCTRQVKQPEIAALCQTSKAVELQPLRQELAHKTASE